MLVLELLIGLLAVCAGAYDGDAVILKVAEFVTEPLGFNRSAGCRRFWIEEEQGALTGEQLLIDRVPVGIGYVELRNLGSFLQHHLLHLSQGRFPAAAVAVQWHPRHSRSCPTGEPWFRGVRIPRGCHRFSQSK